MTPTVVRLGDRAEVVIGGSGGPRIPTLIAQLLLSLLGDGASVGDAMHTPRIHHQFLPDELAVEQRLPESICAGLEERGWQVDRKPLLGLGALIERKPGDELSAALDTRVGID
jgi:gamma-glutamyltranspeptidase/glutathione hydrolase